MKAIYKALALFQQECPPIHQSSQGYGYTYASLNSIFKVINPLLKKNGLGFTQLLNGEDLKTVIFHTESGEIIESSVHIQQNVSLAKMNTFQVLGSAISYYRRYSISAALGLITDSDIDACGIEIEVKAISEKNIPTPKRLTPAQVKVIPQAEDVAKLRTVLKLYTLQPNEKLMIDKRIAELTK